MASSGYNPGMSLFILPCIGPPFNSPLMSTVLKLRSPSIKEAKMEIRCGNRVRAGIWWESLLLSKVFFTHVQ